MHILASLATSLPTRWRRVLRLPQMILCSQLDGRGGAAPGCDIPGRGAPASTQDAVAPEPGNAPGDAPEVAPAAAPPASRGVAARLHAVHKKSGGVHPISYGFWKRAVGGHRTILPVIRANCNRLMTQNLKFFWSFLQIGARQAPSMSSVVAPWPMKSTKSISTFPGAHAAAHGKTQRGLAGSPLGCPLRGTRHLHGRQPCPDEKIS